MLYRHTLAIHDRLETVLRLIRTGKFSTPMLAEEVAVSIPTISRIVAALRERGHDIRSERTEGGWRYFLSEDETSVGRSKQTKIAGKGREQVQHAD